MSRADRFWISFIVRLAFGLFFAFIAIGQFSYGGPNDVGYLAFADAVSKPFADSWLGVMPDIGKENPRDPSYYFCLAIPFTFAILSVPILLGLFVKPALRIGAIFLVLLGLGQYVTKAPDLSYTMQDFFFAFLICAGLYFLGQERRDSEELSAA